jgi:hypothetical protein
MLKNESLKKYIDELIDEVQKELDESNVTGNVDGYQTPFAFSGKNGKEKRKKTATQLGYSIVDNDVENIDESELKGYLAADVVDDIVKSIGSKFVSGEIKNAPNRNYIYLKLTDIKFGSGVVKMLKSQFGINAKVDKTFGNQPSVSFPSNKVISEGKIKRGVNRWLELKNDESMHANKKLSVGLKELKYQLAEVEKFFSWYNKIKNINELDSDNYWKRTNSHIYKIKERIINIARTLQEIEK